MKKIVLVGLISDANLGDQAIYEATKFQIDRIFKNKNENVEFELIDLCIGNNSKKNNFIRSIYKRVKNKLYSPVKSFCNRIKKESKKKINNQVNSIVFCGGGLIKFKQQIEIGRAISIIIESAQKFNIPVMFSGVGVEGYDENNINCQKLKKSINNNCVKYITTRDDINTLNNYYLKDNTRIVTAKVSDSACSINQLYPKTIKNNNTIGLGMIRANLFKDYEIDFSDNQAIELYKELYYKIINSGRKCKFFTNGNIADQIFAERLIDKLNLDKKDVLEERPNKVEDLINIITSYSGMIVARLHASIIAYSYNIPCIGLVWNNKQKFFGEAIECPNRFIEHDKFNAEYILSELENAMDIGQYSLNNEEYKNSNSYYIEKFIQEFVFERND